MLNKIRESTRKHLSDNGYQDVKIFLIDSYKFQKFEFEHLEHHLVGEFPNLKKAAFVLSMQATSKDLPQSGRTQFTNVESCRVVGCSGGSILTWLVHGARRVACSA